MLANTIQTIAAPFRDESDSSVTASEQLTLTRLEETVNRSTYGETVSHTGGAIHSVTNRNQVQFYRTYPKRSGNSRGAAKVSMKFTRDIAVPNADGSGDIVLPLIGELSFSIPVGASPDQITNLRKRIEVLLMESTNTVTEDASSLKLLTEGLQI